MERKRIANDKMDKPTRDVANTLDELMDLKEQGKDVTIFDMLRIFMTNCGDNIKNVRLEGRKTLEIKRGTGKHKSVN